MRNEFKKPEKPGLLELAFYAAVGAYVAYGLLLILLKAP